MRLLYCYVHFLNKEGAPEKYRGLEKIEFNFSTVDKFSYDFETNTLTRKDRTRPLPEVFWLDDPSNDVKTNLYNINVISGENGSGKTTAIHYLIDLLDGIHAAADPAVKDRDRMVKHGVDGNRTLLLFEEAGEKVLIDHDPFTAEPGKTFSMKGLSKDGLHIFHSRSWRKFMPKSKLQRTKVIFLTNALNQYDYERNLFELNEQLRDNFIYDASVGAPIGPDVDRYFPFEVYKQVLYVFDKKQANKRLAYRTQIPELIFPHALRIMLRIELLEKLFSKHDSQSYYMNKSDLSEQLGILCLAAFVENTCRSAEVSSHTLFDIMSVPANLEEVKNGIISVEGRLRRIRKIKTLEGHPDKVNCISVFHDGVAVSGSDDRTLRVWDLQSGDCIHTLRGHSQPITNVAITENGACVSSSRDNTIRIWDIYTGKLLHELRGHSGWVTCLAITADGLCVSGSLDKSLRIWSISSGDCRTKLVGHDAWITCVTVTASGLCISGSWDNTLRVWDIRSGKLIHVFRGHSSWITCIAVTTDNLCISASDDSTLRVWDIRFGMCLCTLEGHNGRVTCVAVYEDNICVSGSRDGTLRVWEFRSGDCICVLKGHSAPISCITFNEDGLCISCSDDKTVRVWNIKTYECIYCSTEHNARITAIATLPEGGMVSGDKAGGIIIDKLFVPSDMNKDNAQALRDACLDYVDFLSEKTDALFSRFQRIDEKTYEISLDALEKMQSQSLEKSEKESNADEEAAKALYRNLIDFVNKYVHTCKPTYSLDFDWGLSSGEENILRLFSNLYHVYNPEDSGESRFIYNNEDHSEDPQQRIKCDSLLLFMDEADLTLHPEWQRRLILILTAYLPQLFPPDCVKDMQVILSTHSPLLLGDIPGENITYLPSKHRSETPRTLPEETFGQNIHTILKESFFLENGTVGAFAAKRINHIAERLTEIRRQAENAPDGEALQKGKQELQTLKQEINIVADGVLRYRLDQLYQAASRALLSEQGAESEIKELMAKLSPEERERLLNELNGRRGNHD